MKEVEELNIIKKNIISLALSMDDAPYHGLSSDTISGVQFALSKVLKGTDITMTELLKESKEKRWFEL